MLLLGIGERTGNIPLEAMVIEYASLRGDFDGMNPTVITEIANYYKNELHYDIPPMTPFVGENFNVTKAGIHADGLMKDAEIYNIFDTEKIPGPVCRSREHDGSGCHCPGRDIILRAVVHIVNQALHSSGQLHQTFTVGWL